MRLFIAALLPDEVKSAFAGYIASLRKVTEGVKWEKEEKLHITLKFLGETDEATAGAVSFVTGAAAGNYAPFEMSTGNLGGFPDLERPHILYAGLSQNPGLSALQGEIDEGLEPHGFGREKRTFVPHVTIGRVNGRMRTIGPLPIPEKIRFTVREISVVGSVLGKTGSVYTPVRTFILGG
ncbi:MAG TPA: RNA 2',3'-cyclic phosphodiesterase [Thermodesulfobacteriota bacterium]|nr:RNA 2',3'-cyclic phosphodiesterase [Thermodesulfobacteriota bacterium]